MTSAQFVLNGLALKQEDHSNNADVDKINCVSHDAVNFINQHQPDEKSTSHPEFDPFFMIEPDNSYICPKELGDGSIDPPAASYPPLKDNSHPQSQGVAWQQQGNLWIKKPKIVLLVTRSCRNGRTRIVPSLLF